MKYAILLLSLVMFGCGGGVLASKPPAVDPPATPAPTAPPAPTPAPPPTAPPAPAPAPPGFTVTILPVLAGTTESTATAINSTGTVVGYSIIIDPTTGIESFEATMWQSGEPIDLGPGVATGINSTGEVSGYTSDNQAWFWSESTGRIMVGVLPGFGFDSSLAQGIDDDGTVVGIVYLNQTALEGGFTWRIDTGLQPVPDLLEIFAIRNGVMAGTGLNGQGAIVANTVVTDLGAVGAAFGINGLGHACGGIDDAYFWQPSQGIVNLGTADIANALNDSDQVVGVIRNVPFGTKARTRTLDWAKFRPRTIDAVDRAMIWTAAAGIVDLNTLVTASDWTLSTANGINDKGEIVGSAFNSAQLNQAYVLEPE